jgi:C-terminal peptidase prc
VLSAAQRAAIFARAWTLVRDRYLYPDYGGLDWQAVRDELEPRAVGAESPEAFYQVLRELIGRLGDEHSRFDSPQDVAEQRARSEGVWTYAGIGVTIRPHPEGGLITRVVPASPAEQAGIQPRDLILAVGGIAYTDTAGFGPGGPNAAVRGTPGTPIRLTVRSPGAAAREVVVTRRVIPADAFPAAEARRMPGTQVGLLAIATFDRREVAERVAEQLTALLADGPLDGLIVDVRDNGGGYVGAMLDTLALFNDGGSIGTTGGRTRREPLGVPPGRVFEPLAGAPLVVLTSDETVSAAEMFAAGMQALGRGRVVGAPSAGNTENLAPYSFADGSRLWLAEYAYRLPDDTSLEGRGVQPDRVVLAEYWRFDPDHDPQILAALEELGQLRVGSPRVLTAER